MATADNMDDSTPASNSCHHTSTPDDQRSRIILMDLSLRERRELRVGGEDTYYYNLGQPHDALLLPPDDEGHPSTDSQESHLILMPARSSWHRQFEPSQHFPTTMDYPPGCNGSALREHHCLNVKWRGDAPPAQFIVVDPPSDEGLTCDPPGPQKQRRVMAPGVKYRHPITLSGDSRLTPIARCSRDNRVEMSHC